MVAVERQIQNRDRMLAEGLKNMESDSSNGEGVWLRMKQTTSGLPEFPSNFVSVHFFDKDQQMVFLSRAEFVEGLSWEIICLL